MQFYLYLRSPWKKKKKKKKGTKKKRDATLHNCSIAGSWKFKGYGRKPTPSYRSTVIDSRRTFNAFSTIGAIHGAIFHFDLALQPNVSINAARKMENKNQPIFDRSQHPRAPPRFRLRDYTRELIAPIRAWTSCEHDRCWISTNMRRSRRYPRIHADGVGAGHSVFRRPVVSSAFVHGT